MVNTKEYYDSISSMLLNDDSLYYNGSLLVDIDTDPETFIDQDVENIIKISNMGTSVLECGCGNGYFFKKLIEKKPDINYTGIDISEIQINNAKAINSDHSDSFIATDWHSLPFEDNSFDTILFLETIGYAKDIDSLLSECRRVLKPGGTLFSKHPGCVNSEFYNVYKSDESLKRISDEYGYESDSLGMMMDIEKFIEKLNEYDFNVPDGYVLPERDESVYLKSHFIKEVRPLMKTVKYGSLLSVKYPDMWPKQFSEEELLSELGKKHPEIINLLKTKYFYDESNRNKAEQMMMMSACVLVTAIKD